ncbi:hypothetical protein NUM3379_25030 [Kineococcus sp. NUM-3379]
MPAGTKGFLDRVLTPGFAYEEPAPAGRARELTRVRRRFAALRDVPGGARRPAGAG